VPDGAAERKEKSHARTHADAANLAMILTESPGLGIVKLRATASARFTLGQARVDVAVAALGAAVDERTAGRGAKPMFLDGSLLAQEVVDCVPLDHRFAVLACRPPPKERS
jgi:hypothetical protein